VEEGEKQKINALAEQVIGAAYEVSNVLGAGFLEKVYERALQCELKVRAIYAETQVPMGVRYKGEAIGDYYADLLVENRLVVELKCVSRLSEEHLAQCLNYLKATGLHLALLINFQNPKVEWRRVVSDF
jgi:GxxExxY protein